MAAVQGARARQARPRPGVLRKSSPGGPRAIKLLLLDQRIVAGLGNIYACEALYRVGIHPVGPGIGVAGAVEAPGPGDP